MPTPKKRYDKLVQFSAQGLTRVDLGQCKDKNYYYHSFKTQLGSARGKAKSCIWLTIDPGQCNDKKIVIIIIKPNSGLI